MRVITIGTFDLFHHGHVELLRQAAKFGELTVGLNTTAFVTQYKGQPPVMSYTERKAALHGCKYVEFVIPNDAKTIMPMLDDYRDSVGSFQAIVVGSDWIRKDYYAQTGLTDEWLRDHDCALVFVPYTPHISTSDIRRRLAER